MVISNEEITGIRRSVGYKHEYSTSKILAMAVATFVFITCCKHKQKRKTKTKTFHKK